MTWSRYHLPQVYKNVLSQFLKSRSFQPNKENHHFSWKIPQPQPKPSKMAHPPPPPSPFHPKKAIAKKKELQKRKTKKKKKLNQKTEIGEKRGERTYSHYQNWRNDAMAKKDEDQSLWNASLSHSLQIKFLSKKK